MLVRPDASKIVFNKYADDDYLPLGLASTTDPSGVLVDGVGVPGVTVDRTEGQVRLRAPKGVIAKWENGLHEITLTWDKAKQAAYIYKDKAKQASSIRMRAATQLL